MTYQFSAGDEEGIRARLMGPHPTGNGSPRVGIYSKRFSIDDFSDNEPVQLVQIINSLEPSIVRI